MHPHSSLSLLIRFLLGLAALCLLSACKPDAKQTPLTDPGETSDLSTSTAEVPPAATEATAALAPALASQLGFARHVPADADLFVAGYHNDELLRPVIDALFASGFLMKEEIVIEDSEGDSSEEDEALSDDASPLKSAEDYLDQLPAYVGDESFLFIGPGTGTQFEFLALKYRETSALALGSLLGMTLDALSKEDPLDGILGNQDEFASEVIEEFLNTFEKDSRLLIPSIVTGWRPTTEKMQECHDMLGEALDSIASGNPNMKPISFEKSAVKMRGYQVNGHEIFADLLSETRDQLAAVDHDDQWQETISRERMEQILEAMESFEFTIAFGSHDGYLVIYLGNGSDGFSLAASPAESLAANTDLTWTNPFAEQTIHGFAYLSEAMVRSGLPALDNSPFWRATANALRAPIDNPQIFRQLLTEMAEIDHQRAQRSASPWSGILIRDRGWRLETRGAWADPTLDYSTPIQMADAAAAQQAVIRAHWVQNRERNDLDWQRTELLGVIFEAILSELQTAGLSDGLAVPEGSLQQWMEQIRRLNHLYRSELRKGLGDEVMLIADLKGVTPPIPEIPEEIVAELTLPRFIIGRPVTDRSMLTSAGESFVKTWKNSITLCNEQFDLKLPLLSPQSIESSELTTWYFPLPISGGDFIPGVSLNERVWLVGTSRSMADNFSKSFTSTTEVTAQTGMIVDIDFEAIWTWLDDVYQLGKEDAEKLSEQAPDVVKALDTEENRNTIITAVRRLKAYHYRHWLSSGIPRTTRHLEIAPAK